MTGANFRGFEKRGFKKGFKRTRAFSTVRPALLGFGLRCCRESLALIIARAICVAENKKLSSEGRAVRCVGSIASMAKVLWFNQSQFEREKLSNGIGVTVFLTVYFKSALLKSA